MIGNRASILGVSINSTSTSSVLNTIISLASGDGRRKKVVFTPNPEFIVEAQKDAQFRDLLNKADINLPDGIGLVWAGKILGEAIKERVSGADVVERLLLTANSLQQTASNKLSAMSYKPNISWTIGIAGARRGEQSEAEELIKRLMQKYPNIVFINLDNKFEARNSKHETNSNDQNTNDKYNSKFKNQKVSDFDIRISDFNIILACHGMKKQEQWIWENKNSLRTNIFIGVGGSLDFLAGFAKRAPRLMRVIGLEWLWRGVRKPKHFLRVWKAIFVFNWLLLKEIMKNR